MKTYLILGKKKINISALKQQYGIVNLLSDMKIETKDRKNSGIDVVFTARNDCTYLLNERLNDEKEFKEIYGIEILKVEY